MGERNGENGERKAADPTASDPDGGTVVELEFAIDGSDAFVVDVSDEPGCEIELETVIPRSDGQVLEFLTVRGVDPAVFRSRIADAPGISEARIIGSDGDETLLEVVSTSRIATALADEATVFKRIVATGAEGRLTAEVPPHVDVTRVIESFLAEYPDAELLARRETGRRVPTLTEDQFIAGLLGDLTEKQLRTLRVAYANGYFEWPRRRTADEVADTLDVATPTFSQHLRVAQEKVFGAIFDS